MSKYSKNKGKVSEPSIADENNNPINTSNEAGPMAIDHTNEFEQPTTAAPVETEIAETAKKTIDRRSVEQRNADYYEVFTRCNEDGVLDGKIGLFTKELEQVGVAAVGTQINFSDTLLFPNIDPAQEGSVSAEEIAEVANTWKHGSKDFRLLFFNDNNDSFRSFKTMVNFEIPTIRKSDSGDRVPTMKDSTLSLLAKFGIAYVAPEKNEKSEEVVAE